MDLKINEKPLFFLGFFDVLKKSVEALRNALGDPLGTPWRALGDALGGFGDAVGGFGAPWRALWRGLGDALGFPLEDDPWKAYLGGSPCMLTASPPRDPLR